MVPPPAQHLYRAFHFQHLIHQPVLEVDARGTRPRQTAHQILEERRVLKRVLSDRSQQLLHFFFQATGGEHLSIFLRVLGKHNGPAHQPGSVAQPFTGSATPALIDSRMPGTKIRCSAS